MELLLATLLGGGSMAVGLWMLARRRAAARSKPVEPPAVNERGLDCPQPGDILLVEQRDWVISGVARLSEQAQRWWECRLEDATAEAWLVLDADDPEGAWVGTRIADAGAGAEPSQTLEHEGHVLRLERFGRAVVHCEGELGGAFPASHVRYWNYGCPGEPRLWLRRSDDGAWSFAGRRYPRHLVGFLPGS